ncbi:type IV pilus biogenesis lipoprotein PilL2 (plasmid) [Pseudomonas fluorescens A506]|nr:type IV pilus biogenesis lipoprotein PilL2 [Pseudomonas fluorescens A506]
MNCKLLASELLCAALLVGCSTAPKLTVPSGDWEEVSQPSATMFNANNARAIASYVPPPGAQVQTSPGQLPKSSVAPDLGVKATTAGLAAPGPATSKPSTVTTTTPMPIASGAAGTADHKASTTSSVAPTKAFPAPSKAPVPAVATAGPKAAIPSTKVTPPPKPVWTATVGQSLRAVIKSWSDRANYTLDWKADTLDYPIDAPLRFEGSYEDAVAGIFQLYDQADRSFIVDGRPPQHRLTVSEDHDKTKRTPQ